MDAASLESGVPLAVVQLASEDNPHLHAFDEVAASLAEGLRSAGFDAEHRVGTLARERRNIVLGAHTLADAALGRLAAGTIVYNHEQVDPTSLLPPSRLAAFSRVGVWDYSRRNVEAWAAQGLSVAHVPIGWSPGLERIDRSGPQDIDVLFYGSMNERRRRVLDAIARKGASVEVAFGVYGAARDALIARARLVCNIQFYEARILEMVRLSYLFANGVPVVSETAPGIDMPPGFEGAAVFERYERLAGAVLALLDDDDAVIETGQRGQQAMAAWPWSRALASVLPRGAPGGATGPGGRSMAPTPVSVVLGPPGPAMDQLGATSPSTAAVRAVNDAVLEHLAVSRTTLGPPPVLDPAADPALAAAVADMANVVTTSPGAVVDPVLALLLPLWEAALDASDVSSDRLGPPSVVVEDPVACVEHAVARGGDPIEAVFVWLSHAIFGLGQVGDAEHRLEVLGPVRVVADVVPELRCEAMDLALRIHAALASSPPDLTVVEQAADRYLSAMALYLPLLDLR